MRTVMLAVAGVALCGCLNLAKFDKKYKEKYCDEFVACGGSGTCPFEAQDDTSLDLGPTCTDENLFDRKAAKDCLDVPWACQDDVPGFIVPVPPAICASVCAEAAA